MKKGNITRCIMTIFLNIASIHAVLVLQHFSCISMMWKKVLIISTLSMDVHFKKYIHSYSYPHTYACNPTYMYTFIFDCYFIYGGGEGGETRFPTLNVSFVPKKGRAVLWYNVHENSLLIDDLNIHGADPVVSLLSIQRGIVILVGFFYYCLFSLPICECEWTWKCTSLLCRLKEPSGQLISGFMHSTIWGHLIGVSSTTFKTEKKKKIDCLEN